MDRKVLNYLEYERSDSTAQLSVYVPSTNIFPQSQCNALWDCFARALADEDIRVIAFKISGAGFLPLEDEAMVKESSDLSAFYDLTNQIEASPKPVIAALDGSVLGEGFELALACHYRIATEGSRLGFASSNIGLSPTGGATQRLPRLIGAANAIEMMLSGRAMNAENAQQLRIVDRVILKNLDRAIAATARNLLTADQPLRPTKNCQIGFSDPLRFTKQIKEYRDKTKNSTIPLTNVIIDCVERAYLLPFEAGIEFEKCMYEECSSSQPSAAWRHLARAEQRNQDLRLTNELSDKPINCIGVLGATELGSQAALLCLNNGFDVVLSDPDLTSLQLMKSWVASHYDRAVEQGSLDLAIRNQRLEKLHISQDFEPLKQADVIFEMSEDESGMKPELCAILSEMMGDDTVLAVHSQSLNIDELSQNTSRPNQVIGWQFFWPANSAHLVELCIPAHCDSKILARVEWLSERLRKLKLVSAPENAYIGGRLFWACRYATDQLLLQGATPSAIDAALQSYGFAHGPYTLTDVFGQAAIAIQHRTFHAHRGLPLPRHFIDEELVKRGCSGRVNGKGYYFYSEAKLPDENPMALEILAPLRQESRPISAREIQERCIAAMANEGARILDAGLLRCAGDLDLIAVHGLGFPRAKGGPMLAADHIGLMALRKSLMKFSQEDDAFWAPAPIWHELIKNGKKFQSVRNS